MSVIDSRVAAAVLALAVVVVGGIMTDTFSGLDFSNDCTWETVEVEGQTFSDKESFKSYWQGNSDSSFSQVEEELDFRTENGDLEYRSCVEQVNQ